MFRVGLFHKNGQSIPSRFAGTLLFYSICSILFGIAILVNPALLAYLIAGFFIAIGITLFSIWLKIRQR